MAQTTTIEKKKWNVHNYLELGEETRCEIFQGDLSMTPAPNPEHQRISRKLEFAMLQYVEERKLGEVFNAPIDVILDEENIVQPDILFLERPTPQTFNKRGINVAPNLVVEILSPSSVYTDRHQKMALYERFKIQEYWIVDPGNKSIEIFVLEKEKYTLFSWASVQGSVKSKILEGFAVDLAKIMTLEV